MHRKSRENETERKAKKVGKKALFLDSVVLWDGEIDKYDCILV